MLLLSKRFPARTQWSSCRVNLKVETRCPSLWYDRPKQAYSIANRRQGVRYELRGARYGYYEVRSAGSGVLTSRFFLSTEQVAIIVVMQFPPRLKKTHIKHKLLAYLQNIQPKLSDPPVS